GQTPDAESEQAEAEEPGEGEAPEPEAQARPAPEGVRAALTPLYGSVRVEHRAVFDFLITFTNGGRIQGQGFRLDVPRPSLSAAEVRQLRRAHLGLLMVGEVQLALLGFVEEPPRGSRGVPLASSDGRRLVELSHPVHHGLVTYPGLPAPEITEYLSRERAEASYGPGVTF